MWFLFWDPFFDGRGSSHEIDDDTWGSFGLSWDFSRFSFICGFCLNPFLDLFFQCSFFLRLKQIPILIRNLWSPPVFKRTDGHFKITIQKTIQIIGHLKFNTAQ
jgi:hypothetical protein